MNANSAYMLFKIFKYQYLQYTRNFILSIILEYIMKNVIFPLKIYREEAS